MLYCLYVTSYSSTLIADGTMTYVDMPLIIPILATGYLLTIYLLLVLAQRHVKPSSESLCSSKKLHQHEALVTRKVSEASSLR